MNYLGSRTHLEQKTVVNSWLYFRNVADQDADDSNGSNLVDSLCIRGDMIKAMFPETDSRLGIMYEPTLAAFDHIDIKMLLKLLLLQLEHLAFTLSLTM